MGFESSDQGFRLQIHVDEKTIFLIMKNKLQKM